MNETQRFRNALEDITAKLSEQEINNLQNHLGVPFESFVKANPSFAASLDSLHDGENAAALIEAFHAEGFNDFAERLSEHENTLQTISCRSTDGFVGRNDDLDRMSSHCDCCLESRAIFVSGLPGIGKTALVTEFCRKQTSNGFKCKWISCRELTSAISVQESFLRTFGIVGESDDVFTQLVSKLRSSKQQTNWIIVMDNAEDVMHSDAANFDELVCKVIDVWREVKSSSCCLLLTSRETVSRSLLERLRNDLLRVNLDKMTDPESHKFIEFYLGERQLAKDKQKSLMESCGRHPLAMELLARYISCSPDLPFEEIQAQLNSRHVPSSYENLIPGDETSCIAGSLLQVFHSLDAAAKDLLVRLSHAAENVAHSVAEKLFENPSEDSRDITASIRQLIDRHLVKISRREPVRYSLHPLVRNVLRVFCENDSACPVALKSAFCESHERLLKAYLEEMVELSKEEFRGSLPAKHLSQAIHADRTNWAAKLPNVLDLMVRQKSDLNELEAVCQFRVHLISNRSVVTNFFQKRLKEAKKRDAPHWVLTFLDLKFADAIRMAGDYRQAGESLAKAEKWLFSSDEEKSKEARWLKALFHRYKGRYLKSLKSRMQEAIDEFKKALDGFSDPNLFPDVESAQAEVNFDMGNAYKNLADYQGSNGMATLRLAKSCYEKVFKVYHQRNPNMAGLFDVHLSLAACEMDIMSFGQQQEDRTTLRAALDHYKAAERIMEHSRDLLYGSEPRMGDLYYSRATCHHRVGDYAAAFADARQALELRIAVYGCHAQTANAFIMLGIVCCADRKIKDGARRAFEALEAAFKMMKRLARKGDLKDQVLMELDTLESYLEIVCWRLGQSTEEYRKVLQAIRNQDRSVLESETSSDSEDDILCIPVVEYEDSSASDSDSSKEDSSAPSAAEARELGAKLKTLINANAELLHAQFEADLGDMEILVAYLTDAYEDLSDTARNEKFQEGEELHVRLKELRNREPSFWAAHAVALKFSVAVALLAFLCWLFKVYLFDRNQTG